MTKTSILILSFIMGFIPLQAQEIEEEIIDNDFCLPEGMQENADSMIAAWNRSQFYQLDSTALAAQDNPLFEEAVYMDRLERIPCIMDMTYNDIVQKYIDQYTNRLRHSVSYMLGAANFYIPIFEEALTYYQIPIELKYLPIIESAFNPRARSRVGAVGLWQFMPATGKRYGLEINSLVDERCDPIKSSYAAARYLKDLYDIFEDWTLVIAAYNCGPNNITKAIHRSGEEKDYWKIYPYLPHETRGYVPAFIAANYIMNYYNEHNISALHATIPTETDTIILSQDVKMERISEVLGIGIDELKMLNPQYNTSLIPGYRMHCTLRLPHKQLLAFIDNQDSICPPKSADEILLAKAESIQAAKAENQKLLESSNKSSSRHSSRGGSSVTVRKGDTLSEIAKRNHTTVAKLRSLNGIRGNNIRAGKKIRVR